MLQLNKQMKLLMKNKIIMKINKKKFNKMEKI